MGRRETEFLLGFAKAALLTRAVVATPPAFTTPRDYMKTVAQLHADADDAVRRGLAVGCLAAVGEGDGSLEDT